MSSINLLEKRNLCIRALACLAFLFILFIQPCSAQVSPDSLRAQKDSVPAVGQVLVNLDSTQHDTARKLIHKIVTSPKKADSIHPKPADTVQAFVVESKSGDMLLLFRKVLLANPYFDFLGKPLIAYVQIHQASSFNELFYFLIGLLFFFGLIKLFFGKYLSNLFTLFFRVSMRQQQIREQVLQAPQPSLLLNVLFLITGGLYATFLIRHFGYAQKTGFWLLLLNCAALLGLIYLVKFCLLKFSGWIFSIQRATDTYIFIVFLTNKVLGVFLLPFVVMISFSGVLANEILITFSLAMICFFYIYRFIVSFGPVRKEIKVNGFHFFLYLCAFEILPLLLIYKLLLGYLEKV